MLAHFFTHDGGNTSSWRLKGHVRQKLFWQWMASWARAVRRPSDIGFNDDGFNLPPLHVNEHVIHSQNISDGLLFELPAVGLNDQREQLRNTLNERCEHAAALANAHNDPVVVWCHLNKEADTLARLIDGAVNVQGSDSEERKEQAFIDFANGNIRALVSKPSIAGFGLNWQHCNHMTYFISHSFEQYYQCIRRSWRFGQQRPVTVDVIATDSLVGVLDNLRRKEQQAETMFQSIVESMNTERLHQPVRVYNQAEEVPAWLSMSK